MARRTPALSFPAELLLAAQAVKLLFLDVDGVLTDGGIYYAETPAGHPTGAAAETLKRFHTLDGYGIKLLQRSGIVPVVVSGRDSLALRARLQALDISQTFLGVQDKLEIGRQVLQSHRLEWREAAAMGDDWPDLGLMLACAFSAAPANAHIEVRALAKYVTQAKGGAGALREVADLLLMASGRYAALLAQECR